MKPCYIYNSDETGLTRAPRSDTIVAPTNMKKIGGINSYKRETFVSVCFAVNAVDNIISFFFLLRQKYHKYFLVGSPRGTIVVAKTLGECNCRTIMAHIYKFCQLVHIWQNTTTYIYTQHKPQLLEKSEYCPFKKYFSFYFDNLAKTEPGKCFTLCWGNYSNCFSIISFNSSAVYTNFNFLTQHLLELLYIQNMFVMTTMLPIHNRRQFLFRIHWIQSLLRKAMYQVNLSFL